MVVPSISVCFLCSSVCSDPSYMPETRTQCKVRAQHISWSHVLTRLLLWPEATTPVISHHLRSPLRLPYHIPPPPTPPEPPPPVTCTHRDNQVNWDWRSVRMLLNASSTCASINNKVNDRNVWECKHKCVKQCKRKRKDKRKEVASSDTSPESSGTWRARIVSMWKCAVKISRRLPIISFPY